MVFWRYRVAPWGEMSSAQEFMNKTLMSTFPLLQVSMMGFTPSPGGVPHLISLYALELFYHQFSFKPQYRPVQSTMITVIKQMDVLS